MCPQKLLFFREFEFIFTKFYEYGIIRKMAGDESEKNNFDIFSFVNVSANV